MHNPIEPPLLTADIPGVGGAIKRQPGDFEVEEVPAYEPSGVGEHLFLWIEKTGMGAEYFARQIAGRLDLSLGDVGIAGLKDRHAVTRQYVSVPATTEGRLSLLDGDGIRVLRSSRHVNKLRAGHLRGNRFRLLVRDADRSRGDDLNAIVERIRSHGLVNYYGEQRFGVGGDTSNIGMLMLRQEPLPRRPSAFLRKLALSAVQSWLFNAYLARRFTEGLLRTVIPGEVMAKWPVGGMFNVEDIEAEQPRLESREIVPAGPMFGRKMFAACGEAAEREAAVLRDANLTIEQFGGFGKLLQGTRRHALIYIDDLSSEWEPEGLRLTFTLPTGSYATVLLREVMKVSGAADVREPDVDD